MKRPCEMTKEEFRLYQNERNRCWRKANPEQYRATNRKRHEANRDKLREQKRKWRKANSEKVRALSREWAKAHPERVRENRRNRYKANPEKARERHNKWRKANIEKARERSRNYMRKWRKANPEKTRALTRRWAKTNREKVRDYIRKRYSEDPQFSISCKLRSRLRKVLKSSGSKKCTTTIDLLGCSIESFKSYIEKQFKQDMTWFNTHIDHIIPCAMFDLTKPEHQKQCFGFSNFQPLFIDDNRKKGSRLFYEPGMLRL